MATLSYRTKHEQAVRNLSRMAIASRLCANPGEHRVALATKLNIPRPTMAALVRDLVEEGWLLERESVSTGKRGGRPVPLFLRAERFVLLGIHLTAVDAHVVATSLDGQVLATGHAPFSVGQQVPDALDRMARALIATHGQVATAHRRVVGIGMGLSAETPGHGAAQPAWWSGQPIADLLSDRLRGTTLQRVAVHAHDSHAVAAMADAAFQDSAWGPADAGEAATDSVALGAAAFARQAFAQSTPDVDRLAA